MSAPLDGGQRDARLAVLSRVACDAIAAGGSHLAALGVEPVHELPRAELWHTPADGLFVHVNGGMFGDIQNGLALDEARELAGQLGELLAHAERLAQ